MANNNRVLLKKSSVEGKIPANTDIQTAELAINLTDKVLYSKDTANSVFLLKADPLYNTGLQDNLDAKVDIAGDTMTGDLEVQGTVTVDNLQFNLSANNTVSLGEATWNIDERTFNVGLGNGVVGQGFQELYYPLVKNNTIDTIPNGTPVYASGNDNGVLTIDVYIADGSIPHEAYLGLTTEEIASGARGLVSFFGRVREIDTGTWDVGTPVYVSADTAGELTIIPPSSPNDLVLVGFVSAQGSDGSIDVRRNTKPRSDQIPYDNTESGLTASNVKSAIDELQNTKLDVGGFTASLNLYPTTANTVVDEVTYLHMVNSFSAPDYNTTANTVPTGVISGTNQLLSTFITDDNIVVGNPGVINVTTVGNIMKTAGNNNQNARFYFTISLYRDEVTTLIATSNYTNIVEDPIDEWQQFNASAVVNDGEFLSTDRFIFKYYGSYVTNPGGEFAFQFGGSSPVRTLVPVPVNVIPPNHAEDVLVDTSNFNGILSGLDDDVQTALETIDDTVAPLESPSFTGTPLAPTAALHTNTTQVATTAFVETRGIAAEDMALAFSIALG